ncbi:hypothetical protein RHOSPDRAFT_34997 [Rhodotorula sp. JG-1b]|nr:hypothetical protein RHOSPDRAFT_34997 [Rhodotorula sp. JG-1b]
MTHHDALSTLVTAVENWRQRFDSLVSNLPVTPNPSEGFAHIPPSPVNITLEYSTNTTHPRVPDATVGNATAASGAQVDRNQGGTARSQALQASALQPSKNPGGPFRYLKPSPSRPEWTAGSWARLYALLQAIGPRVGFNFPQFTREEIFILAFLSEPTSLPQLPKDPLPTTPKHAPVTRLGLEHIYHRNARLNGEQSRHVLTTSKYKDLQAYARIFGKIIDARDACTDACDFLIEHELKNRLGARTTSDPVRRLIPLVQTLRDDPSSRLAYFAEPAEPGQSRPIKAQDSRSE